jgi:hypothetical protein
MGHDTANGSLQLRVTTCARLRLVNQSIISLFAHAMDARGRCSCQFSPYSSKSPRSGVPRLLFLVKPDPIVLQDHSSVHRQHALLRPLSLAQCHHHELRRLVGFVSLPHPTLAACTQCRSPSAPRQIQASRTLGRGYARRRATITQLRSMYWRQ